MRFVALAAAAAFALSGCGASAAAEALGPAAEVRLGYFANVTHAPALIGLEQGLFEAALGDTKLNTQVFNAGPAAIEAISAGAIDIAYIGPSPAINTYIRSAGQSAVIVAGATSGGAALVVRDGIDRVADLSGATIATPQLGNTQDVALRSWLADEGFETSTTGAGDVTIQPTENSDAFALFKAGDLDGAWVPEPWVSRLVVEGGAHVLVDEAELWEDGVFPTTVVLVNKRFLIEHAETVTAVLEGHLAAIAWLGENPDQVAAAVNAAIEAETGKALADAVIDRALENVTFSADPIASTFPVLVEHAVAATTGTDGDITGLFDLTLLNELLKAAGADPISAAGLGTE